ncbi:L-aspartate oxidase [Bacillus ndiopicus]|uniref:L-aspartate oxidase n=1 Tax=Bacillus ndiopicus TaxID=1347368 RepID=UPI0005A6DABA|nr:L-aspartate oxidase [Bacillus ndiopicus]
MYVKTDVLIIGSGIAALQAANILGQHFHVQLVTKSSIETSSSYRAQGGIAAVTTRTDHIKYHIHDTLRAGEYHHTLSNVETLIKDGAKLIDELLQHGLPVDRHSNGEPILGLEGAHSFNRILHAGGDQTGKYFIHHLLKKLPSTVTINDYEAATELLLNTNGECIGAFTLGNQGQKCYLAHHIIIASGGAGALYNCTSNFPTNTGDGIALAYLAGAAISDMEFMQFHPTLLCCNGEAKGLVSEAVRGAGAIFVDAKRQPIMKGHDLAPRHITAYTLFMKRLAGEETFLDISMIEKFEEKFPTITKLCVENGISLQDGLIPVAPGSHFLMGGIIADSLGQTSIPSLYAVGEVACTGVHGANRLASNSLLEAITFGHRMAQSIVHKGLPQQNFIIKQNKCEGAMPSLFTKAQLQQKMMETLGIVRDPLTIHSFLQQMPSLQALLSTKRENFNHQQMELYMMHIVAILMAEAALTRTETRGAHIRIDYPSMDEIWANRWIIFSQGHMEVRNFLYEHHQIRGNAEAIFQ